MNHQSRLMSVLKERLLLRATASTISPATAKRMPAKSILLPVMSAVMPKALKPILMSGNAHPHAIAAVRANTVTHTGRWNIEVLADSILFFTLIITWI
jgi:hypothetical protein